MTNSLTMCKLETMIYASEDPEVCQRKERGEAGGVTYQVRNAAVSILPV